MRELRSEKRISMPGYPCRGFDVPLQLKKIIILSTKLCTVHMPGTQFTQFQLVVSGFQQWGLGKKKININNKQELVINNNCCLRI